MLKIVPAPEHTHYTMQVGWKLRASLLLQQPLTRCRYDVRGVSGISVVLILA